MGAISIEKANRLFWLGRYAERVLTTLITYFEFYDEMIDGDKEAYRTFCDKIGIPDIYGSKENFQQRYLFDQGDPNSILCNMERAFDNGVVMRGELGTYTLAYIQMALDVLKGEGGRTDAPAYDLQQVIDYLNAFWGCMDDQVEDQVCRNIIKCGKYLERLDLYMRLDFPYFYVDREFNKFLNRLHKIRIGYNMEEADKLIEVMGLKENWVERRQDALTALWNIF